MADYDGYEIRVTEFTGNLMAGDCTGLDREESPHQYCNLLRDRLEAAFPGAEIDIRLARAEGVCPEPRVYSPNLDMAAEDAALVAIGSIEEALFSSGEWYVDA